MHPVLQNIIAEHAAIKVNCTFITTSPVIIILRNMIELR